MCFCVFIWVGEGEGRREGEVWETNMCLCSTGDEDGEGRTEGGAWNNI